MQTSFFFVFKNGVNLDLLTFWSILDREIYFNCLLKINKIDLLSFLDDAQTLNSLGNKALQGCFASLSVQFFFVLVHYTFFAYTSDRC